MPRLQRRSLSHGMTSPILEGGWTGRPTPASSVAHARDTFHWAWKPGLLVLVGLLLSGCAVYYRDRDTGAEHIWGFGHLAVKTVLPNDGKQALVQRMTLTGFAIGMDNGSLGVSAGYDRREHILIFDENTAITIERPPSNDLFTFTIGTYPFDREVPQARKNSIEPKETSQ